MGFRLADRLLFEILDQSTVKPGCFYHISSEVTRIDPGLMAVGYGMFILELEL